MLILISIALFIVAWLLIGLMTVLAMGIFDRYVEEENYDARMMISMTVGGPITIIIIVFLLVGVFLSEKCGWDYQNSFIADITKCYYILGRGKIKKEKK